MSGVSRDKLLEALERVIGGDPAQRIEWSEKTPAEQWLEAVIAPVAPSGCPSAMALPMGFTMAGSMPRVPKSRMQARACGAKASLSSTCSIWEPESPALRRACNVAGTGPQPMICGSQAATPSPAMRASGAA